MSIVIDELLSVSLFTELRLLFKKLLYIIVILRNMISLVELKSGWHHHICNVGHSSREMNTHIVIQLHMYTMT